MGRTACTRVTFTFYTSIYPSVSVYYKFRKKDHHETNRILNTISGRMQNILTISQIKMTSIYLDIYSLILVKVQFKCDGTRWRTGKGKWRGNWRMEWVANTFHTTSEHVVSSISTTDAHNSAASSWLNWLPADLNGLVRFAEIRNLVSARVPSHFKRSLPLS
jgi:hypothetical protein